MNRLEKPGAIVQAENADGDARKLLMKIVLDYGLTNFGIQQNKPDVHAGSRCHIATIMKMSNKILQNFFEDLQQVGIQLL